jgi:hypothetical protein
MRTGVGGRMASNVPPLLECEREHLSSRGEGTKISATGNCVLVEFGLFASSIALVDPDEPKNPAATRILSEHMKT